MPVPELDERFPIANESARRASLRVIALRVDPCTGETMPKSAMCRPQLRLVIQSLRRDGGALVARDGAMHAFFALGTVQFTDILDELRAARAAHADAKETRLDVHPRLVSEGLAGAHAQRLRALIEKYAVELVRLTHFRRLAGSSDHTIEAIGDKVHWRAEAMQKAAWEMREKRPHPYYWASFVIIGRGEPLRGTW